MTLALLKWRIKKILEANHSGFVILLRNIFSDFLTDGAVESVRAGTVKQQSTNTWR